MILFASPRFAEHTTPPGHPESPERADVFLAVADACRGRGLEVREPRPATHDELARVHTEVYLEELSRVAGRSARLDPDTFTSPETIDVARLAAGAAVEAALAAWREAVPCMALVRPPGHHAEPDHAMGFCFYNNIAIAARAVQAAGAGRVAIIDIDVHHGNGTETAFYRDASVFYASTHQFPFYPGSGGADSLGRDAGLGTTLNVPLEAGTRDEAFLAAYDQQILPAIERFEPDMLLISAGFDAHECDPLAGLRVTTGGYRDLVARIDAVSRRICRRRTAWITEGGYNLGALRECLEAAIDVLI